MAKVLPMTITMVTKARRPREPQASLTNKITVELHNYKVQHRLLLVWEDPA
jgi:hypothetical protein